jgi:hypothetical protein
MTGPEWKPVFGRRNRWVGCAVSEPDGRWKATRGPATLGVFASLQECKEFLIARADQGGER